MDIMSKDEPSRSRPKATFVVGHEPDDAEPDSDAMNVEAGDMEPQDDSESVGSWADDESDSEADEDNEHINSRHFGFLLTLLSPSMDIVAVWRFPYIAYKHGGIILLPFIVLYLLVGIPVAHLELTLGQLFGGHIGGNCALGSIVPWLRGICFSSTALLALMCIYHMTIVSWCLFYFFTSMQDTLPWAQCQTNITKNCFIYIPDPALKCFNGSCQISSDVNYTVWPPQSSSEHYFQDVMLNTSNSWFQFGPLMWKISLCLLCAWFLVFLDVRKGKISFRKTCILPSISMFVLLCAVIGKSTTDNGFQAGLKLYFTYDWTKLKDFRMWIDASTQVVLSSGIGTGLLQVMGRRSHILTSLKRDALLMAIANVVASFISGLVAFSCLGFLAAKLNYQDLQFLQDELGTAFIVFTAVLTEFPAAIVMSIVFFLVLVITSLKRQRVLVYALATAALEGMHSSKAKRHRSLFITAVCVVLLAIGFIFTFNIGVRLLLIMDLFVFGWPALVVCLVECLAVMLLYDKSKFLTEIQQLLQSKLSPVWTILWTFITPTIVLIVLLFGIVFDSRVRGDSIDYTSEARLIGWSLVVLILCFGPIYAAYRFASSKRKEAIVEIVKSETESVLQNNRRQSAQPINEESVKPHWHALAMRRKGSITPAPKILVVKMDESSQQRYSPIIPYGFVLTPKKETKSPKNQPNRILAPQLGELLSQNSATNCVNTIAVPSPHPNRNGNVTLRNNQMTPKSKRPATAPIYPNATSEMVFAFRDSPVLSNRPKSQGPQMSFLKEPPMRPRAASDGGGEKRRKEVVIEVDPTLQKTEICHSSEDHGACSSSS